MSDGAFGGDGEDGWLAAAPHSAREGQIRSAFAHILERLCGSCTGSLAAVLVDDEGESVDHASPPVVTSFAVAPAMKAFVIKLAAAHWQLVMRQAVAGRGLGAVRQLWVEAETFSYVLQRMPGDYVLLFVCRPAAVSTVSYRALRQCEVELALEAGWPVERPESPCWTRTRIKLGPRGTPHAAWWAGRWRGPLAVLGHLDAGSFERGYRVALPGGGELDLVREPTGLWYAATGLPEFAAVYTANS